MRFSFDRAAREAIFLEIRLAGRYSIEGVRCSFDGAAWEAIFLEIRLAGRYSIEGWVWTF